MFLKNPRYKKYDGLVKSIWATARNLGLDEQTLRDMVYEESNHQTRSSRELTRYEKLHILHRLRGNKSSASKEQIWLIENVFLSRLGWSFENFSSWLRGSQSPFRSHTQAEKIISQWPSAADQQQRKISITAIEASQIIEGLKGSWRYVAGVVDINAEKRRMIKDLRPRSPIPSIQGIPSKLFRRPSSQSHNDSITPSHRRLSESDFHIVSSSSQKAPSSKSPVHFEVLHPSQDDPRT